MLRVAMEEFDAFKPGLEPGLELDSGAVNSSFKPGLDFFSITSGSSIVANSSAINSTSYHASSLIISIILSALIISSS
jgi:hypothetical protein